MMIRVLAIDDEPLALQQLASYIEKIPFLQLVAECQSALEARTIMNEEQIDAIFVDINMPDLSGMDFVRSLAAPPLVVFTTAYSEYAVEGFRVNAIDYLLKPFGLDDFKRAANKVKAQYDLLNTAVVSAVDEDDALFLKTEYKVVRINVALIVLLALKKLEERLPSASFMRIHRSYLINLKKIQEVNKNRVIMDADTYLPIGDMYKEAFNQYLSTKFLGK